MTAETYNSLSSDYQAANPRPPERRQTYIVRWYDGDNELNELTVHSRALAERVAGDKYRGSFTIVRS